MESFTFSATPTAPNSALPLLLVRGGFPCVAEDPVSVTQALSARGWDEAWHGIVYPFPHFHSNGHELLVVTKGSAVVAFGGETGQRVSVGLGDVVVIPAGVVHQGIESEGDFTCLAAYPAGQPEVDLRRCEAAELPETTANVARVALPRQHPVLGGAMDDWLPQCEV